MSEWYESFFDALAVDVWRALVPASVSDAEAAFLLRQLAEVGGDRLRLLDAPCGDGRLALRVAARGHDIVGIDHADHALYRLRADDADGRVDARMGDLRHLRAAVGDGEVFDGAWCMGNSFGYLSHADTVAFLASLASCVRPGGRFVLDAATAAELVLPGVTEGERDVHEQGGARLGGTNSYEASTSTLVTVMTLELGDRRAQRVARHRVMTCREIVALLEEAGFAVEEIAGGLDGEDFRLGAERCLITSRRA